MNKLYIIGALAIAAAEARVDFMATPGASYAALAGAAPNIFATSGLGGTYTYAYTGDCISSGSLTTLGLNNNYYQYYYVALTKGTAAVSTTTTSYTTDNNPAGVIASALITITNVYNGCYHMHIYNWIAMPSLVSTTALTSVTSGYASAVVGYGYAMTGTATTACAVSSIVTSILFLTNKFYGAQFQGSIWSLTSSYTSSATAGVTTDVPVWGRQGPGYYATKTTTAIAGTQIAVGVAFATSQNSYWDFMQSNTIQGLTTLGRGGGLLGTGPCGWYVGYFYEAPARGISHATDTFNVQDDAVAPTLNFWTDNSVIKAASAFVVASLAALLF